MHPISKVCVCFHSGRQRCFDSSRQQGAAHFNAAGRKWPNENSRYFSEHPSLHAIYQFYPIAFESPITVEKRG